MDQNQRELRRAAAKAFMESLEQLGQEFQLQTEDANSKKAEQPISADSASFDPLRDMEVPPSEPNTGSNR